jgi:hypothetical protein
VWQVEISIHLLAVERGLEQLPTIAKNDVFLNDLFFFHGLNTIERESSICVFSTGTHHLHRRQYSQTAKSYG